MSLSRRSGKSLVYSDQEISREDVIQYLKTMSPDLGEFVEKDLEYPQSERIIQLYEKLYEHVTSKPLGAMQDDAMAKWHDHLASHGYSKMINLSPPISQLWYVKACHDINKLLGDIQNVANYAYKRENISIYFNDLVRPSAVRTLEIVKILVIYSLTCQQQYRQVAETMKAEVRQSYNDLLQQQTKYSSLKKHRDDLEEACVEEQRQEEQLEADILQLAQTNQELRDKRNKLREEVTKREQNREKLEKQELAVGDRLSEHRKELEALTREIPESPLNTANIDAEYKRKTDKYEGNSRHYVEMGKKAKERTEFISYQVEILNILRDLESDLQDHQICQSELTKTSLDLKGRNEELFAHQQQGQDLDSEIQMLEEHIRRSLSDWEKKVRAANDELRMKEKEKENLAKRKVKCEQDRLKLDVEKTKQVAEIQRGRVTYKDHRKQLTSDIKNIIKMFENFKTANRNMLTSYTKRFNQEHDRLIEDWSKEREAALSWLNSVKEVHQRLLADTSSSSS